MKLHGVRIVTVVILVGLAGAGPVLADPQTDTGTFFDVFTELGVTSGPPYPSSPVQTLVSNSSDTGTFQTEILSMSLQDAGPDAPPLSLHASDSGGGVGAAGVTSFFDVFTEPPPTLATESFFDVFVELLPPSGGVAPILTAPPVFVPGPDSFFDVFFSTAAAGGIQSHHLHGEIGPGQGLQFTAVQEQYHFESFFDVYVGLLTVGPVDPSQPIVTMTLTGTWTPEPATLGLLTLGGVGLLRRRRR